MSSNKKEPRINPQGKMDCQLYGAKRSASALHIPKVKHDRNNNSKLQTATDSRLPVCKVRKTHNCIDNRIPYNPKFNKPPSVLKRKSISLVELRPQTPRTKIWTHKKWESKEHVDDLSVKETVETKLNVSSLKNNDIDIARRVCKMFILNAWRHRRAQVSSLRNKLTKMGNEVENLGIQVVVLRDLLESEKGRVAGAMSEAAYLNMRLESELKEKNRLKNELDSLEDEKNSWKNQERKMISEIHSLKDELTLTSEQNKYLRRECDDFDKTIIECKQKESQLQSQLKEITVCLKEKTENFREIQSKSAVLLSRMTEMKKINQNLLKENGNKERKMNEFINKISDMDVALNNSQNTCKVLEGKVVNLERDLVAAEEKVKTQTIDIENLRNKVDEYESEKEESNKSLAKVRNRIIFGAIKISASLLMPYHPYL